MKTHTMRKLIASLLAITLTLFVTVSPLMAQSFTLNNTTLSGAITATATSLVLASASASTGSSFGAPAAGDCLFIEGELMRITAMASTTATVQRGPAGGGGQPATAHATSAVIFTADCNAFFKVGPPLASGASCNLQPAPWIDTVTANVWWCNRSTNLWTGTNFIKMTFNSVPVAQ